MSLPQSRYLFFGGKGGVGKTTVAAATALYLLDRAEGAHHLLLFSTDPAHSLSDSLGKPIGDAVVEVTRQRKAYLFAYEMDATAVFEEFKTRHRSALREIANRGTFLDQSDINQLLSLSLPGMDEVMALFKLSDFERERVYSRIVIDTAPSGHTSRFLALPKVFAAWMSALERMTEKHRFMAKHFGRGRIQADEVEQFLRAMSDRIERMRAMLYDRTRTAFTLVTTPEEMSIEETRRYLEFLESQGITAGNLIINRIEQEHEDCRFCRARLRAQQPALRKIAREFSALQQHKVPLFPVDVRGLGVLREVGRMIWQ